MTTQPEALKLAGNLEALHGHRLSTKAAAELRRLHESNQELLAALNEIDSWLVCACIATPEDMAQSFPTMQQVASAAIAKAKRKTT